VLATLKRTLEQDSKIVTAEHIHCTRRATVVLLHGLQMQYFPSREERAELANTIIALATKDLHTMNTQSQGELFRAGAALLKFKHGRSQLPVGFTIDGEPLYELARQYFEHKACWHEFQSSTNDKGTCEDHIGYLSKFISVAKRYFTREFAMKMLDAGIRRFSSQGGRFTTRAHEGVGIVRLFFPLEDIVPETFLEKYLMVWLRHSESGSSVDWARMVFSMLAVLARKKSFLPSFAPFLHEIYGVISQWSDSKSTYATVYEMDPWSRALFGCSGGGNSRNHYEYIAEFVVRTLACGVNASVLSGGVDEAGVEGRNLPLGATLLHRHMCSMDHSFHPSTTVKSSVAATMLNHICNEFVKYEGRLRADGTHETKVANQVRSVFSSLFLPFALKALYHPSSSFSEAALHGLGSIVLIDPDAVREKLLPQVYSALDPEKSLSHTHQAPIIMRALTHTFWHITAHDPSAIAPHIETMLSLILPGIDPNDKIKTMHALNFFAMFFASCPLVDLSDDVCKADGDNFSEMIRASALFEGFAVEFLQRMLNYADKTGKLNGNMDDSVDGNKGLSASEDKANILDVSLGLSTRFFFFGMSESILSIIVKDLIDHIRIVREHTMGYHCLLKHAGRRAAAQIIKKFIPFVKAKIFGENHRADGKKEDRTILSEEISSTSLEWYILALASICSEGGSVCLAYKECFVEILDSTLLDDRENVRKAAGRLFRYLLHNALSPSVNKHAGNGEVLGNPGDLSLRNRWCKRSAWGQLKFDWREPNVREYEFVQCLVDRFVHRPIATLRKHFKKPFEKLRAEIDSWKHNLHVIIKAIQGIVVNEEVCSPLRPVVADFCNEVFHYFGKDEKSDPKILKQTLTLSRLVISTRGSWNGVAERLESYFVSAIAKIVQNSVKTEYMSAILESLPDENSVETLRWEGETPRFSALLLAEALHNQRISRPLDVMIEPHEGEPGNLGRLAKVLILDVSQNEYRDVRTKTAQSIDEVISTRYDLCRECCDAMIDIISMPSLSTGSALGTLSMFMKKRILYCVTADWNLTTRFFRAVSSSVFIDSLTPDNQREAQTILTSITVAVASVKQKHVPGLTGSSWGKYAIDTIAELHSRKSEMRWFHILVATALMFLSKPVSTEELEPVSESIFKWHLELLHREEQPLHQLALWAYLRLPSSNFGDGGGGDVNAACTAILLDHRESSSASAPRSLWTPGVRELLRHIKWGPTLNKGTQYPVRFGNFVLAHGSVASRLRLGKPGLIEHTVGFLKKLVESSESGIEKNKIVTVAEIFSGSVRGEGIPDAMERAIQTFWPLVEDVVGQTPLSWIGVWCCGFSGLGGDITCARMSLKLIGSKLSNEFDVAGNSKEELSFSGPTRWMCILSSILQEVPGYNNEVDGREVVDLAYSLLMPLLMRASKSPFDTCRKSAAYIFSWLCVCSEVHGCVEVGKQLQFLAKSEFASIDAGTAASECACHWVKALASYGPPEIGTPYLLELIPATLKFQNASAAGGKHVELVKLAREAVAVASSHIRTSGGDLESLLQFLKIQVSSDSWHHRIAALHFIVSFYRNHLHVFSLAQKQELNQIARNCLRDKRPEVQDGAREVLTVMMHFCSYAEICEMCDAFSKMAKRKVPKHVDKVPNKTSKAYRTRLAGVLGLTAIVERYPYSVPEFVPSALVLICSVVSDPGPASGIIKRALAKFKRTHNDEWTQHMTKFTEFQLECLQDFFLPNNYYA
jgi:hypothetical protein